MEQAKIEPGIYSHFKGGLYFVLALAWSRNDPINPHLAEVIYHPLYPVENLGWRRDIRLPEFFEQIDRAELKYSGPKFFKVVDWKLPNILPGAIFKQNGYSYEIKEFHHCSKCANEEIQVIVRQRILGGEWQDNVVKNLDWLKGVLAQE